MVCCTQHTGVPVFRFPAFKHQPCEHIAVDIDRGFLVACSAASVRAWSLDFEIKQMHQLEAGSQV